MVWSLGVVVAVVLSGSFCQNETLPPGEEGGLPNEDLTVLDDELKDNVTLPELKDNPPLDTPRVVFPPANYSEGISPGAPALNKSSSSASSGSSGSSHGRPSSEISAHILAAKCMGSLLVFYFVTCLYLAVKSGPVVVH